MVICTLMTRFDMRFEEGFDVQSWEDSLCDYFIPRRGRLPVVFLPRPH
jgi:hypothetical protein